MKRFLNLWIVNQVAKIVAVAAIGASVLAVTPSVSLAQDRSDSQQSQTTRGPSMRSRLGSSTARNLLASPDDEDQIRGVQRLGAQNDFAAIQILLQDITDTPKKAADPRVRIEMIRAMAPFASRAPVRAVLVSWMMERRNPGRASPLGDLAADQAAMALSAYGNTDAIRQLVLAIPEGEEAATRAANALLAHPPALIEPFLLPRALESKVVVEVLGEMGDLRAIPALRKLLTEGDISVRVAAGIALARLGDSSAASTARDWLAQEGSSFELRIGTAQILTLIRDPYGPRAIAVLLADPATRDEGIALAELAPTQQLASSLAGLATISEGDQLARVFVALANCGGPLAAKTLESLLQKSNRDAAVALGRCRGPEASAAISRALRDPKTRRIAARAALVRAAEQGMQVDGLASALGTLSKSSDPADRFVGVFGLVFTGRAQIKTIAKSEDPLALVAACNASVSAVSQRAECKNALAKTTDMESREAFAASLFRDATIDGVSTSTLFEWAETPATSAPVFARLLGSRDAESVRPRIERLLFSGDPDVRAQMAIGLGESTQPSVVSLLARAYAFEQDPVVRRAVVTGIASVHAKRRTVVGRRWLETAEMLDPDTIVRATAHRGLSGNRRFPIEQGEHMLWLRVGTGSDDGMTGVYAVRVVLPDGSTISAVTAPDGEVLIPSMAPGLVSVRAGGTSLGYLAAPSISRGPGRNGN